MIFLEVYTVGAIRYISEKIKLYENLEKSSLSHLKSYKGHIVYGRIDDVNFIENSRKNLNIFPLNIKQDNLKNFLNRVDYKDNNTITIKNINTGYTEYNKILLKMIEEDNFCDEFIKDMYEEGFEFESIAFKLNEMNFDINKRGLLSINYPDQKNFDEVLDNNILKQIIGIDK